MTVTETTTELPTSRPVRLMIEGKVTADKRKFSGITWREPPLSVVLTHEDHDRVVGSIRDIVKAGSQILGVMDFDLESEDGRMVARQVRDGHRRGLSVELGDQVVEVECHETDEEGFCVDGVMHTTSARIGTVALAPFGALEGAEILPEGEGIPEVPQDEREAVAASGRYYAEILTSDRVEAFAAGFTTNNGRWEVLHGDPVGSTLGIRLGEALEAGIIVGMTAGGGPLLPPRNWFEDPDLTEPTALSISEDGRVFGHVAAWGTCHIGRNDICLTPPSGTDYRLFLLGERDTDEGTVAVGQITLGTDHPDTRWAWGRARDHYADTGCAVADIVVGEDPYGIWCAGAVRPDATDEQIVALKAAKLSGDWRPLQGKYELVAALAVNTPGFPIPRTSTAIAASGEQQGLVAAGIVEGEHKSCGCDTTGSRLDRLEAIVEAAGLESVAVEAIAASLRQE